MCDDLVRVQVWTLGPDRPEANTGPTLELKNLGTPQ